eukprot:765715-Hanusia_phi.AAC.5
MVSTTSSAPWRKSRTSPMKLTTVMAEVSWCGDRAGEPVRDTAGGPAEEESCRHRRRGSQSSGRRSRDVLQREAEGEYEAGAEFTRAGAGGGEERDHPTAQGVRRGTRAVSASDLRPFSSLAKSEPWWERQPVGMARRYDGVLVVDDDGDDDDGDGDEEDDDDEDDDDKTMMMEKIMMKMIIFMMMMIFSQVLHGQQDGKDARKICSVSFSLSANLGILMTSSFSMAAAKMALEDAKVRKGGRGGEEEERWRVKRH